MPIITLLAAGAFSAQELKLVTISSRGEPLSEIVRQASEQSGIKASAGPLGDLPVIIKVSNMTGKSFLENVAKAVGGVWHKDSEGDGVVLARDTSLSAEALARNKTTRVARLAESMKQQAKSMDSQLQELTAAGVQKQIDRVNEQIKKIEERPGGNERGVSFNIYSLHNIFLREALLKVPAKDLANLGPGERLVYSTSPNPRQRKLPYNPSGVREFFDVRSRIQAAAKKFPVSPYYRIYTGIQHENVTEASKLIIRFTNHDKRGSYLSIESFLVGPEGQILSQGSTGVGGGYYSDGGTPLPKGKVTIRPESLALSRLLAQGNRYGESQEYDVAYPSTTFRFNKQDEKVVPYLLDPVAHEPVSFAPADALFSMAETLKKPLIAYLPDPAIFHIANRLQSAVVTFENLFVGGGYSGFAVENTDNLLMVRTDGSDNYFTDRRAFKEFLGKLKEKGYLFLREITDYGKKRPGTPEGLDLDFRYLNAIAPTIAAQVAQMLPPARTIEEILRVRVDTLPVGTKDIPANTWSPAVLAELEKKARNVYGFGGGQMTEIQRVEPTELDVALRGDNLKLRLTVARTEAAYAIDPSGAGRFLYAHTIGMRGNPILGSMQANLVPRTFEAYQMADVKQIHLAFVYSTETGGSTPGVTQRGVPVTRYESNVGIAWVNDLGKIGEKTTNLDQFSDVFRQQVDAALKQKGQLFMPEQRGWKPVIPPQP